MNNIFYKFFYLIFDFFSKNSRYVDANSFPILSIGIISVVLDFNFLLLQLVYETVINDKIIIEEKFNLILILFIFLILSIILGINGKYKKIYAYYKNKQFEKNKYNGLFAVIYILLSFLIPLFWIIINNIGKIL